MPLLKKAVPDACSCCNAFEMDTLNAKARDCKEDTITYSFYTGADCPRCERWYTSLMPSNYRGKLVLFGGCLNVLSMLFRGKKNAYRRLVLFVASLIVWFCAKKARKEKYVSITFPLEEVAIVNRAVEASMVAEKGSQHRAHGTFIHHLSGIEEKSVIKECTLRWLPSALNAFNLMEFGASRKFHFVKDDPVVWPEVEKKDDVSSTPSVKEDTAEERPVDVISAPSVDEDDAEIKSEEQASSSTDGPGADQVPSKIEEIEAVDDSVVCDTFNRCGKVWTGYFSKHIGYNDCAALLKDDNVKPSNYCSKHGDVEIPVKDRPIYHALNMISKLLEEQMSNLGCLSGNRSDDFEYIVSQFKERSTYLSGTYRKLKDPPGFERDHPVEAAFREFVVDWLFGKEAGSLPKNSNWCKAFLKAHKDLGSTKYNKVCCDTASRLLRKFSFSGFEKFYLRSAIAASLGKNDIRISKTRIVVYNDYVLIATGDKYDVDTIRDCMFNARYAIDLKYNNGKDVVAGHYIYNDGERFQFVPKISDVELEGDKRSMLVDCVRKALRYKRIGPLSTYFRNAYENNKDPRFPIFLDSSEASDFGIAVGEQLDTILARFPMVPSKSQRTDIYRKFCELNGFKKSEFDWERRRDLGRVIPDLKL